MVSVALVWHALVWREFGSGSPTFLELVEYHNHGCGGSFAVCGVKVTGATIGESMVMLCPSSEIQTGL